MFRKEIKISFLPFSAFPSLQTEWILHCKPGISGIYSNSLQLAKALQALSCTTVIKDFKPKKEWRTLRSLKFSSNSSTRSKGYSHGCMRIQVCSFLSAQSSPSAKSNCLFLQIKLFLQMLKHLLSFSISPQRYRDLLVPRSSLALTPGSSSPLTSGATLRRDSEL